MKKKILVVTGTRAEYGLLKPVITEIVKDGSLSLRLLATGMHTLKRYGYSLNEIKKDGVRVDAVVPVGATDSMAAALAKEIRGIEQYCVRERPDLIVILGDRDEPYAAALVAAHLNIPLAHIHGGDVSGPATVDEKLRNGMTTLSHLHFPISQKSAERIKALGEESWRVQVVGAPGLDAIVRKKFAPRAHVARKLGVASDRPWIIVLHHPSPFDRTPMTHQIRPLLESVTHDFLETEKIVIYPNTDTGSRVFVKEIERLRSNPRVHIFKNLSRDLYLEALHHAHVLVGNSSSGIIESTTLRIPSISVGNRQRGREHGKNVVYTSYARAAITRTIRRALSPAFRKVIRTAKSPYGNGTAGARILRAIKKHLINPRLLQKKSL